MSQAMLAPVGSSSTLRSSDSAEMREDHQEVRRSPRLAKLSAEQAGAREVGDLCEGSGSRNSAAALERLERRRKSLFYHVAGRQVHGCGGRQHELLVPRRAADKHLSQHLPGLLRQCEYKLGTVNKVFAARWLGSHQVVMGTKCNKLLVLDIRTKELITITSMTSSCRSQAAECPCGIHAIACNPSRTLLATGGENTNDVAVYRLPTFDPLYLGEEGHRDWIFDIVWVDDEFFVTGSRDGKLALWRVCPDDCTCQFGGHRLQTDKTVWHGGESCITANMASPVLDASRQEFNKAADGAIDVRPYRYGKPVEARLCPTADKVRALAYNEREAEIGVLSLNSKIHIWDVKTFQAKLSRKLPHNRENVCLSYDSQRQVYAVGSQSHVTIVDSRSLRHTLSIESRHKGSGVRSVGFNANVVTIGTGGGSIFFYDMTAGRYMDESLAMGAGYLRYDETWRDFFAGVEYANAVYAHCYDETNTRLFAAGGPLPAGLWGNYAAVWQ